MKPLRVVAAVALLGGWAGAAGAQQPVQLQFQDGRVTLRAQNAPVRAILAEWARLGGATIVNGDRVTGPPVTLELAGVPERQALDVVLRNVAGYMLAPRPAGSSGASAFDRIMILPTSAAPTNPPPPSAAAQQRPGLVLPRPSVVVRPADPTAFSPDDLQQMDDAAGDPGSELNQLPPSVMPPVMPQPVRPPMVLSPDGSPELLPEGANSPTDEPALPMQPGMTMPGTTMPGVTTVPGNPFGIPTGSSARPGVISPVPGPQQQQQQPAQERVQ